MWQSLTESLLHTEVHLDVDIGNHLDSVELTLILEGYFKKKTGLLGLSLSRCILYNANLCKNGILVLKMNKVLLVLVKS